MEFLLYVRRKVTRYLFYKCRDVFKEDGHLLENVGELLNIGLFSLFFMFDFHASRFIFFLNSEGYEGDFSIFLFPIFMIVHDVLLVVIKS